jgi:hypothetical protein
MVAKHEGDVQKYHSVAHLQKYKNRPQDKSIGSIFRTALSWYDCTVENSEGMISSYLKPK